MQPNRALVVVDDESVRRTLRAWLSQACNVETRCAANTSHALDCLDGSPVDLIVLDISAGVEGGLHAIEALRRDLPDDLAEIVVLSDHLTHDDIAHALKLGVSDCLAKPLVQEKSIPRLCSALGRAQERRHKSRIGASRRRAVIADPDLDFQSQASLALSDSHDCQSAHSLSELCVNGCSITPDLILLSEALPGFDLDSAIRKLDSTLGEDVPPILLVRESGLRSVDGRPTPRRVDGVVRRCMDRLVLRDELVRILRSPDLQPHELRRWIRRAETSFNEAIGYCFSQMMDKRTPTTIGEIPIDSIRRSIDLTAAEGNVAVRAAMRAPNQMLRAATVRMLGMEENEVDDDAVDSCYAEILNLFAGRIKALAANNDLELMLRLPDALEADDTAFSWAGTFAWDDATRFQASVSLVKAAAAR